MTSVYRVYFYSSEYYSEKKFVKIYRFLDEKLGKKVKLCDR